MDRVVRLHYDGKSYGLRNPDKYWIEYLCDWFALRLEEDYRNPYAKVPLYLEWFTEEEENTVRGRFKLLKLEFDIRKYGEDG